MGFSNAIRVRADRIRIRAKRPKRFSNTISARADRLMGFYNAIRIFMIIAIVLVRLFLQMIQRSTRSFTEHANA